MTPPRGSVTSLLALWLCAACVRSAPSDPEARAHCQGLPEPLELRLERVLPVEGVKGLEPSGLLMSRGRLLMVSDKHDDAIFELSLSEHVAHATRFAPIAPPDREPGPLDLEGLAQAEDGSWLLVSEARYRVLQVRPDGGSRWLTSAVRERGQLAGLFRRPNAGLEGLAMHEGSLLLAAEREPRGLLESDSRFERWQATAMPSAACPAPRGRPNDFADLSVEGARVFALVRNAHLVVELRKRGETWQEAAAHSYARAENDARLAYEDRRFGLAEGLAVDPNHFYVALDNNGQRRGSDTSDRRPLLLVLRR